VEARQRAGGAEPAKRETDMGAAGVTAPRRIRAVGPIANLLVGAHVAGNESVDLQAFMSQLTVRNVSAELVRSLKQRAAAHGRSAEAEHREILREALREGADDFEARAKILRGRLRTTVDSSEIIRADRDRDGAA